MRNCALLALLCLVAPLPCAAEDAPSPEDELRAVERAFAKTMADRDHAAFTSFLAEETIFFVAGDIPLRGKEAVAEGWKAFFAGEQAPFSWEPTVAVVLESGTLGLTSGPVKTADGNTVGSFNSVWRRDKNGEWRVVFDRGCH